MSQCSLIWDLPRCPRLRPSIIQQLQVALPVEISVAGLRCGQAHATGIEGCVAGSVSDVAANASCMIVRFAHAIPEVGKNEAYGR